jgi:PAS domain S-box-containing protein
MKCKAVDESTKGKPKVLGALERRVRELEASLLLHDRMGKIQIEFAQKWQSIFDAINDPVSLVDQDGKIVQCNRAMCEFLKKSAVEIIGSTCWEVLHGEPHRAKDCLMLRINKSKHRETACRKKKDGREFQVSVDPLKDGKGRIIGGVHIITAISKAKAKKQVRRVS